ncbi:MAG: ATP-binding protein [Gammaproteobacteria bacterium]
MDTSEHLHEARAWLANYYINIVAIIGPPIGALTLYRVLFTEDITISLLPLSLVLILWPITAWFKNQIALSHRMILVVGVFMIASVLVTVHRGLHSHIMLTGPIAAFTLTLFYGKRGFWIATCLMLVLITYATVTGMIFGHVDAVSLESPIPILYRGTTMGLLAIISVYSIYGVTSILTKQADVIADQELTIFRTSQEAEQASSNLELLEDTVDCIILTIQEDGRVSYQNDYAREQLVSFHNEMRLEQITATKEDAEKFLQALKNSRADQESKRFSCQLMSSDRTPMTVEVNCKVRQQGTGDADLVCVAQDVTELLDQRDRLRQAEKFEALGEACARISHDYANLLTIMSGNLSFMQESEVGEEYREALADIKSAVSDSKALTQQIGQYSTKQRIDLTPVDLDDFMAKLSTMGQSLCPEEIAVSLDTSFAGDSGWLDETLVTSMVLNIVSNARDAIDGEGAILIKGEYAEKRDNATDVMMISIEDNGCGIAAEHLNKVTDPFFSTKKSSAGLGLGLSTVARQLEAMGGHLKIASEVGVGTTMVIELPVAATEALNPAYRSRGF